MPTAPPYSAKEGGKTKMSELAYSYHTFLFPFLWNDGGETKWDVFEKVLSTKTRWIKASWEREQIPKDRNTDEWLQDYAAFQYFTEPANNVIFNTRDNDVVRCFKYQHNGLPLRNNGQYIITKGDEDFTLVINGIRLHVYDIGVAILILELENRVHASIDAVNKINEYGRRVNMPFLKKLNKKENAHDTHPLCADRIEVIFDGTTFETEDYIGMLNDLTNEFETATRKISLNYIMKPIKKLIDGGGKDNGGYKVTSNKEHKELNKLNLYIKPCVDDRMFVCCLVADNVLSDLVKGVGVDGDSFLDGWDRRLTNKGGVVHDSGGNQHASYMEGWADETTFSNKLYKLLFVEKDVTCQNTVMKKELLLKSIYRRWTDMGTLYGATHHSLICVTNTNVVVPVINPFLTIYIQLAILVLAQRSSILALSGEAAEVAKGFTDNTNITSEQISDIEQLQAKYIKAQNQLLLFEATVQEQGVELYRLIREQLYIGKNKEELDKQMSNLRDAANISNDRLERKADKEVSKMINILAIIGVPLGFLQLVSVWFTVDCSLSTIPGQPIVWGAAIVMGWLLWAIFKKMRNKANDGVSKRKRR